MMNPDGKGLELLDILTIVSFILNLESYGKNVDQTQLQETMNNALKDIHQHLSEQDKAIEELKRLMKGE